MPLPQPSGSSRIAAQSRSGIVPGFVECRKDQKDSESYIFVLTSSPSSGSKAVADSDKQLPIGPVAYGSLQITAWQYDQSRYETWLHMGAGCDPGWCCESLRVYR